MRVESPRRVTRTYLQRLLGTPEEVFALLCPVREADWVDGWDPLLVVSDSGVAEADCVFVTEQDTRRSIWYITRHEPGAGLVEMLKITPDVTACRLTIVVRPSQTGCEAAITYTHTSLGPHGDAFLAGFSEGYFAQFMREWEDQCNHFLTHKQKRTSGPR